MRLKWIVCIAMLASFVAFGQSYVLQPTSPYGFTSSSIVLYAYCVDSVTGQFIAPCSVTLYNGYYPDQNEHMHNNPRPSSAYGHLSSYGGAYSAPPGYIFTFFSSRVGGLEYVTACPDGGYCTFADMWVRYQDIFFYGGAASNVFVGATQYHPTGTNHAGTTALNNAITAVTNQYQNEFSCYSTYQKVGVNDMALPSGGLFDVGGSGVAPGTWQPPHHTHDRGKAVDFRWSSGLSNSIINETPVVNRFLEICP